MEAELTAPRLECLFCNLDLSDHDFHLVSGLIVTTPPRGRYWVCPDCAMHLRTLRREPFPCPMVQRCRCEAGCVYASLVLASWESDIGDPFASIMES